MVSRKTNSEFSLKFFMKPAYLDYFDKQKQSSSEVAKILKGSLDSIPSPSTSVKIQIIAGKVYLR
jgi:hypothetical protein